MNKETIISAPQCNNMKALYDNWLQSNHGSYNDFVTFMTTPSVERSAFISRCGIGTLFEGAVLAVNVKV